MSPQTTTHLHSLPAELLDIIFVHCRTTSAQSQLKLASLVCRKWHKHIARLLFRELVVRGIPSPHHFTPFLRFFEHPEHLHLCIHVHKLTFSGVERLNLATDNSLSSPTITTWDLYPSLQSFTALEHLNLDCVLFNGDYFPPLNQPIAHNLTGLTLHGVESIPGRSNPLLLLFLRSEWNSIVLRNCRWYSIAHDYTFPTIPNVPTTNLTLQWP